MWLFVPFIVLLVLAIIGGLLVGGIYAAVLLPIVAIVLIAGMSAVLLRRSRAGRRSRPPGWVGPPTQADSAAGRETAPDPALHQIGADADTTHR
jgi:membrane protein implicated in regulation of membrane protease activity